MSRFIFNYFEVHHSLPAYAFGTADYSVAKEQRKPSCPLPSPLFDVSSGHYKRLNQRRASLKLDATVWNIIKDKRAEEGVCKRVSHVLDARAIDDDGISPEVEQGSNREHTQGSAHVSVRNKWGRAAFIKKVDGDFVFHNGHNGH